MLKQAQEAAGLRLSEVPSRLLEAYDLELAVWSSLVDDACIRRIAALNSRKLREGVAAGSQLHSRELDLRGDAMALMLSMFSGGAPGERVPFGGITSLVVPGADISDAGLLQLAVECTSLRRLNLSECARVSDVSVRALAKQNRGLEGLDLSQCVGVAGAGLVAVGECCPQLRVLRMRASPASDEWLLKRIAFGLPELRELDLSQSSKVNDEIVRTVARCCRRLERVSLALCREVSDVGVLALARQAPALVQAQSVPVALQVSCHAHWR